MGLIEIGAEVTKVLIPPKTNDLEEQQRWRWVVFVSIIGLTSSLLLHIALACGYIPALYAGFASATATEDIQRRVDVIATLSLQHEIRSKAIELCIEKSQDKRNELNDDISKLQKEYHDIAQTWYAIPGCSQL